MKTVGIIAEFNPFHNGHKYLIDTLKTEGYRVVCVIGDDFTQRGDVALISKFSRAEAAIKCGADLCLLLPSPWSMSCAYNFALGGVSILKNLGCVDTIAFGSECGDIEKLLRVSDTVHSDRITPYIGEELKKGTTFAKARQTALEKIIGSDAEILSNPNDTLATEYIAAAKALDFSPEFIAVSRVGCEHDSQKTDSTFASASFIRENYKTGDVSAYMPKDSFDVLCRDYDNGLCAEIERLETAVIAHLRRMKPTDFYDIPEVSEGIENRIIEAARTATKLTELYENAKTKRYTMARIRRIVMSSFLGINLQFFGQPVPYIKVLGFNKAGEGILKDSSPTVPLINRSKDYLSLTDDAADCFAKQRVAADIYGLATQRPQAGGRELSESIIKI